MTILVFGKSGQVGREIQSLEDVVALGRDDADLTDPDACRAAIMAHQPSAVINAAAYTKVDEAEREEELATIINGEAPEAMAETCCDYDIPFVHISTDYVFDGSGDAAWEPEDVARPLNAYGRSKLAGEKGIRAVGGRYAILRTSWVFSSYGSNFLKTMLRLAENRTDINIVNDQIGGPTPACDVAGACLSIANHLRAEPGKSGVYHLSGAPDTSWADFARAIFSEAGKPIAVHNISTREYPTAAIRPHNSRLDCQAILAAFNLAQPDWRAEIRRILHNSGAPQ